MTARRSPEDLDLERRLGGVLIALEDGVPLGPAALGAVRELLLSKPGVVAAARRQRARDRMDELVKGGCSARAAAQLVAAELDADPDTVRSRWW